MDSDCSGIHDFDRGDEKTEIPHFDRCGGSSVDAYNVRRYLFERVKIYSAKVTQCIADAIVLAYDHGFQMLPVMTSARLTCERKWSTLVPNEPYHLVGSCCP